MPLVACPKCATNLKIPDGASGNVKCPKCNNIFSVSAPAAPAFEVVEDQAPKPARPAAKPQPMEPDFEVVDEPKRKKRDDDDDDDRPRKKRRDDDDDDDDRPRSKRRRDDDYDDDDDDDRRKKKKKRRRDYDDHDEWRPAAKGSSFGPAKVGMLMISISLWLYLGTFALLTFFLLIAWIGASIPSGLLILTGLLGLANWIVALIGLGFCIAGPSKSRGLAIAATAVAAVHLIMAFVVANSSKAAINPATAIISMQSFASKAERLKTLSEKAQKETDPAKRREIEKELREFIDDSSNAFGSGKSDMRWQDLATTMMFADIFISELCYNSRGFSDYVLSLLAGLVEVARLILIVLLIGAVARAARDEEVAQKTTMGTIIAGGSVLLAMIVFLIAALIAHETESSTRKVTEYGIAKILTISVLIVYLVHLGSLFLPSMLAMNAKDAAASRAR